MNYLLNSIPDEYSKLILDFLNEYEINLSRSLHIDNEFNELRPLFLSSSINLNEIKSYSNHEKNIQSILFSLIPITNIDFAKNKVISIKSDSEKLFFRVFLDSFDDFSNKEKNFTSKQIKILHESILKDYRNVSSMVLKVNDFSITNKNHLVLDLEKLIGSTTKQDQISEFRKILDFLEIDFTEESLIIKIANTLNRNSFQEFNYTPIDYDSLKSKKINSVLKKSGIKKLNLEQGFGIGRLQKIRTYFSDKSNSFYDKYWKSNSNNSSNWVYGINIIENLINNYDFTTILDAGCGSADVTRFLLNKGYNAKGIELSGEVLKMNAQDLLKQGIVQQGSLTNLPYNDNSFDVVFSSEVLEHIPKENIELTVSELVRVTKEYLFLTISLRPSSNFNKYHITLKPREWWEEKFIKLGCVKDHNFVKKLQKTNKNLDLKGVLMEGPTKNHINEMEWFIDQDKFSFEGELEPWYFIFKKNV